MSRTPHPLRDYIDSTFAPEDALLQRVRTAGEALRPGMQISAGEGKLLYMLARLINARRVLEIGCFMGYSAIWLARALPADQGELITLESRADYAEFARTHFAEASLPITLLEGVAQESIRTLQGTFDLIFIDADKTNYADYLEATLPFLRSGGLMVGDNTLLFGAMLDAPRQKVSSAAIAAMRRFNHAMNTPPLEGTLIPTEEGLSVARKR